MEKLPEKDEERKEFVKLISRLALNQHNPNQLQMEFEEKKEDKDND